jgi:hypothetical protein
MVFLHEGSAAGIRKQLPMEKMAVTCGFRMIETGRY